MSTFKKIRTLEPVQSRIDIEERSPEYTSSTNLILDGINEHRELVNASVHESLRVSLPQDEAKEPKVSAFAGEQQKRVMRYSLESRLPKILSRINETYGVTRGHSFHIQCDDVRVCRQP